MTLGTDDSPSVAADATLPAESSSPSLRKDPSIAGSLWEFFSSLMTGNEQRTEAHEHEVPKQQVPSQVPYVEDVIAKRVQQENMVEQANTMGLTLEEYQSQLDSIANQAMLLLGFVMASIIGSELCMFSDPTSVFCFSKTNGHFVATLALLVFTELTICLSLLCIAGSAYAIQRGRYDILHVGWLQAVYRTRRCLHEVLWCFAGVGLCFLCSLTALLWLMLGLPVFVDVGDEFPAYAFQEEIVTTIGNVNYRVQCLDMTDDEQVERHVMLGHCLAHVGTAVLWGTVLLGVLRGFHWSWSRQRDSADPRVHSCVPLAPSCFCVASQPTGVYCTVAPRVEGAT